MSSTNKWKEEAMNATNKWEYDHRKHYDTSTGTGMNLTMQPDKNEQTKIERKSPRKLAAQPFSIYETEQKRAFSTKPQTVDLTYKKPHNKNKKEPLLEVKKPPVWGEPRPATEEEEKEQGRKNSYNKAMWTTTTRDVHQPPAWEPNVARTFNKHAKRYDDMHRSFLQKVADMPQRMAKMPPKTTKEEIHNRKRVAKSNDPCIQYKDEQLRGKNRTGGSIVPEKNASTIVRKEDEQGPPRYTKVPGLFTTTNQHMMTLQEKPEDMDDDRFDASIKNSTTREAMGARAKEGKHRSMETTMSASFQYDEEKMKDNSRDFTDPKYRRPQVFKRGIHGERKLDFFHKPGVGGVEMGTTIHMEDELVE